MYLSKDKKDQESSRNYVTWGMAEGSEELREFKIILNTKGNYFLVEEIYSIKFQRSWCGDMTGIYTEVSWDQQGKAHSKDYGCHTWNLTPSL